VPDEINDQGLRESDSFKLELPSSKHTVSVSVFSLDSKIQDALVVNYRLI